MRFKPLTPAPCKDCGGSPVFHTSAYITLVLELLLKPLFEPATAAWVRLTGTRRARGTPMTAGLLDRLVRHGMGEYLSQPDDHTPLLAKCLWEEAAARDFPFVEFRPFGLPKNTYVVTLPDGSRLVYEGIPEGPHAPQGAWWMDDKARMKEKFLKRGFPVAKGGAYFSYASALAAYRKLVPPVIVKPYSGSGSRHTTLHIESELALRHGFRVAKKVAPLVLLEEELVGDVYRATVVNGKLAATLRRMPPYVVGGGAHTVAELIVLENQNPLRHGPIFSPLTVRTEELVRQGLTLESVPEKGRRVDLAQKVNWGIGGTTEDVTDDVHPDNRALFEDIAAYLTTSIVGIDFIIADIGKSWKEQARCGVIECNSMPFFDNHHLPFKGKPRNVAAAIWDGVLA